jgi:hypothetical protein
VKIQDKACTRSGADTTTAHDEVEGGSERARQSQENRSSDSTKAIKFG